jgi:hypothetical protein
MCWEVESKNKKETPYIFNKARVFLKIHEKYVVSFPFISHSDVIFQQISIYKTHASNKNGGTTIASQQTSVRSKVGCDFLRTLHLYS